MTDNPTYWAELAAQGLSSTTAVTPATEHHDRGQDLPLVMVPAAPPTVAPELAAPPPPADDLAHGSGVALHPRMRLALDELLDAESVQTHNLAILVGRVRRVPVHRRAENTQTRADTP